MGREGALVAPARLRAVDRLPRLAADEQHDRRQREDVVARGEPRLRVDVDLDEWEAAVRRDLLEVRLDRRAGFAPRRPEVDDRRLGREDVAPEVLGVDRADHSRPARVRARRAGTFQTASSTIARLIFEPPTSRSAKVIGTSTTRKPLRSARYVSSIWKA